MSQNDDDLQSFLRKYMEDFDRSHRYDMHVIKQLTDIIANFGLSIDDARRQLTADVVGMANVLDPNFLISQRLAAVAETGDAPPTNGRGGDPRDAVNNLRKQGLQ